MEFAGGNLAARLCHTHYQWITIQVQIPECLANLPQWMRDSLQLDRMYTPYLPA